ncbi:MAG: DUF799 family lipoprotein [Gammaproteobacteria bacterium]|nr:DUF799 family lipoprotein [Gammaproteobacteria bacterium]
MKIIHTLAVILFASTLAGCAVQSYDYSALEQSKPRSILVIPPVNDSVEVNAPYVFLSTISKPLAEKGYYVFPVGVIDEFLKQNGLPTPAEMHTVPLEKFRENIGADAVLYVNILEWGQKFQLLSSNTVVSAEARLVDARNGTLLWETHIQGTQSSDSNGGGLVAALIGAVAQQVAGSLADYTKALSATASSQAINDTQTGLLPGPYARQE